MAGGKGSRLKLNIEKPLLEINNKKMIDYIIEQLLKSDIKNIYVAISPNTINTKKYIIKKYSDEKNIKIINTNGNGYIEDLNQCISFFSKPFMVLSSDIPTISFKLINNIIQHYYTTVKSKNIEALCVVMDKSKYKSISSIILPEYDKIPVGINILSPKKEVQKEDIYLIDNIIININTINDIKYVENTFKIK